MTDTPKKLTAEERAGMMALDIAGGTIPGSTFDYFLFQLQQAVDEARKDGYEKGMEDSCAGTYIAKSTHDKLVLEARKAGFEEGVKKRPYAGMIDALKYANGPTPYERGFATARGMAKYVPSIMEGHNHRPGPPENICRSCKVQEEINAIQPPSEG